MKNPKVSVICLCHNQADFVQEAVESVLNQVYENTELIIVDDGSTDDSKKKIKKISTIHHLQFIDIPQPIGNCRAFNKGLKSAAGDFIIDLAADDILLPERIKKGLQTFQKKSIGVEFCNVMNIDQRGKTKDLHFQMGDLIPEGDVYLKLITQYFISPPGMMIKRAVLEELNGYDEELLYEDFDFWIRSSRIYLYGYTDEVLVKKRDVNTSLSKSQFRLFTKHQRSTLVVCKKIKLLNKSTEERKALRKRCFYEIKNCLRQGNISLIPSFIRLIF